MRGGVQNRFQYGIDLPHSGDVLSGIDPNLLFGRTDRVRGVGQRRRHYWRNYSLLYPSKLFLFFPPSSLFLTKEVILVLGVSLSAASHSKEGFGILTMASVGPIITVLVSFLCFLYFRFRSFFDKKRYRA